MEHLLDNPVYHALATGDAALSFGTDRVKFFDEAVSPFAGFDVHHKDGFAELYDVLPAGRRILYATIDPIDAPPGWQQVAYIKGVQFVFDPVHRLAAPAIEPEPLTNAHAAEMVQLAALTRPGPFAMRTIAFGHYYGFFENEKLVAMTGQRLHVANYSEVSAVCTHPGHLGKGYATALLQHQLNLIIGKGEIPFLHVREDNARAIEVYERLGFKRRGAMHFYFLKRKE